MGFSEAAALRERRVAEVVGIYAQAGRNVVADEVEPCELIGSEGGAQRRDAAATLLLCEPGIETLLHRVAEGFEERLLFEGEAHERDEVSEAAGLRAAFHFFRRGGGEGAPEVFLRPCGVGVAELLLQLLQHGLGEALGVGAAI